MGVGCAVRGWEQYGDVHIYRTRVLGTGPAEDAMGIDVKRTSCEAIRREPFETLTWPFAMMEVRRRVSPSEEPLPLCLSQHSLNERSLALIVLNLSPSRPAQHTRDVSKVETIWGDSRCKVYVHIKPDLGSPRQQH